MENSQYQNGCWWIGSKYAKCPKTYLPKLSVQAQKFGILIKKGFIGRP
jgi:hypothetical protein